MTNEEVLKEINKWLDGCPFEDTKKAFRIAMKALEKPQGEWIFQEGVTTMGSLECSRCKYLDFRRAYFNYCPNCGAYMKKEI